MAASVSLGTPAAAWTPLLDPASGEPAGWAAGDTPLSADVGTMQWHRAMATWAALGPVALRPSDGEALITLASIDDADAWMALVGDPGLVAFTLVSVTEAGSLSGAEVLLNAARFRFGPDGAPGVYGVGAVLTHELGHALGLGHSCGDADGPRCEPLAEDDPRRLAVMFPTVSPGAEPRAPTEDDEAGAAAVLPELQRRRVPQVAVEAVAAGQWRVEIEAPEGGERAFAGPAQGEATPLEISEGILELSAADPEVEHAVAIWTPEGQGIWRPLPPWSPPPPDAGITDAAGSDASAPNAGATDAGATDAGATDAGATDAGATGAGLSGAGADDGCAQRWGGPLGLEWALMIHGCYLLGRRRRGAASKQVSMWSDRSREDGGLV